MAYELFELRGLLTARRKKAPLTQFGRIYWQSLRLVYLLNWNLTFFFLILILLNWNKDKNKSNVYIQNTRIIFAFLLSYKQMQKVTIVY